MHCNAYDRILGILCSVLDAYSAVLFLRDVSSDGVCDTESSCHLKATFSLGDKVKPSAVVEPGKGLVGWILRNGEPLLVPNFDQRRHQLGYYREGEEDRIKAFMGCALPGGYGVLCVDSKRQYSFSEKDQKLLHLFAELLVEIMGQIGLAEEQRLSLRYYAALKTVYTLRRRHSRWAEFLHQFLQLMAAAGGFSYALFCSLRQDKKSYAVEGENEPLALKARNAAEGFSVSGGLIGWVFRNGTPFFSGVSGGFPDTSLFGKGLSTPHFQTIMVLPLIIQGSPWGVLCLADEAPLSLAEETRAFAGMAAEHLALFLENLFIKCRLRDAYQSMMPGDGFDPAGGLPE